LESSGSVKGPVATLVNTVMNLRGISWIAERLLASQRLGSMDLVGMPHETLWCAIKFSRG
jgi:hypothetical protein